MASAWIEFQDFCATCIIFLTANENFLCLSINVWITLLFAWVKGVFCFRATDFILVCLNVYVKSQKEDLNSKKE